MGLIETYVGYFTRPQSLSTTSVAEASPNLLQEAIICCAFFSVLCVLIPKAIETMYPKFYQGLSNKRKFEIPTYISCCAHHLVVVPYGFYHIYLDFMRTPEEALIHDHAVFESKIVPYCIGYLFADMAFLAIKEALVHGKYENFLHHAFSFIMIYFLMNVPGNVARFIPHILICETSQLFFLAAWFFRLVGIESAWYVTLCEAVFCVLFTILRVVNLPMALWKILDYCGEEYLLAGRLILWPIQGLQFFWFYKIISSLLGRLNGGKKSKKV